MSKFRHGNEGQIYNVKRDNSLNMWQGSNNWKKHKPRLFAQEIKNKLRAQNYFLHTARNILFPVGYLKIQNFKYVEI